MEIHVISVIQTYQRRINSKSKVRSTTFECATRGGRNRCLLWRHVLSSDQYAG